jgi:hypothetical protein
MMHQQNALYGWALIRAGIPLERYTLRGVEGYYYITPWLFQLKVSTLMPRFYEVVRGPFLES